MYPKRQRFWRGVILPRPAAFIDRDGVLNVDHGYTYLPEDLQWTEGARAAIYLLNEAGYFVFVVTNQSGVARGYYDELAVNRFHLYMQNQLKEYGAHVDAFYYCPHHPNGVIKRYAIHCNCRKPGIGLLEQASAQWTIDRNRSFLIGDKDTDLQAANAFGIRGALVKPGAGSLVDIVKAQLKAGVKDPY